MKSVQEMLTDSYIVFDQIGFVLADIDKLDLTHAEQKICKILVKLDIMEETNDCYKSTHV